MKSLLDRVLDRRDLSAADAEHLLELLTSDSVSAAQAGAVLTALRMKGESMTELLGMARLLRRHARHIDCGPRECVDIVGTGGDGGISFNVSTTSAFAAAGAGVVVAKHGNRAVSGKCGAADVMAALGFDLDAPPERMEYAIQTHGIGFLFAPKMHPMLGKVAGLRRELGFRTIFNLLGPLCNPAGASGIVLGVYDPKLTELLAETLRELGVRRALVVSGHDGLDEISCGATTRVSELDDGVIRSYELFPELLLGTSYPVSDIAGGTAQENAAILKSVLSGQDRGAARSIVLLNAAAAIRVAGLAGDLREAVLLAALSIDSGAAMNKLDQLIAESRA
ncbi:MAG: anthranilate phosphoribosyltransferase [Lentisphaeria bacterium]|nr:anthranilate phosphoribosyltransferase [Lentisphaeria bacterium]